MKVYYVMEYYDGNTLEYNLYTRQNSVFPEDQIRFHVAEIISGLMFLHQSFVKHW